MHQITELLKRAQEACAGCGEVLSSCCHSSLSTVPGSLPLQVSCDICKTLYTLRNLLNNTP